MALLDRLQERVETDLSDVELQAMIDEVTAEIARRFGPLGAITVLLGDDATPAGDRRHLLLDRPMDTAQAATAVEIAPPGAGAASARTTLDAADWRVLHGGRTIERLIDGPNGRRFWAPRVELTYTPVSDTRQRDEVTIKVVQLDLSYRGLDKQESAGDHSRAGSVTADAYSRERDALLGQLRPKRGLQVA